MDSTQASSAHYAAARVIGNFGWAVVKSATLLCVAVLAGAAVVLSVMVVDHVASLVM
jgi:hypothetical protein